jgi:hypothetical protein
VLKASYVFGAVPPVPVLLASRAQTDTRYVPGAWPTVVQLKFALDEYRCTSVHVPPGGRSQNSYCALEHPAALPVMVTGVPTVAVEAGEDDVLKAVHGEVVSV